MKKYFIALMFLCVVLIFSVFGQAFDRWPDTGQTTSYTDIFGEDSDYSINPQSYTKLGPGGLELPDGATVDDGWVMTKDNVTGLFWEVKQNKDGRTDKNNHNDANNYYVWCDTNSATNGGDPGICEEGSFNTTLFINDLNYNNFGGFSDWRLPTVKELSTIVNSNVAGPSINTTFFPNTISGDYWSSTTAANHSERSWYESFNKGKISYTFKYSAKYVRAVRDGQSGSGDNLVDNGNGTVTDKRTGLMWQKVTYGPVNWESAITYSETLSLAGHKYLRLPDKNELQSLADYSRYDCAIDPSIFPDTQSYPFSKYVYWSSTTTVDGYYAWYLSFYYGDNGYGHKTGTAYVRAVRAGAQNSYPLGVKPVTPWIPLLLLGQ